MFACAPVRRLQGRPAVALLSVLALLSAVVLPSVPEAQTRLSMSGATSRNLPEALVPAGRGWRSVGRLETGGGGFCTVTLIAPDRALTAAHCVMDSATGSEVPVARLQVQLGLTDGRAEATRGVRRIMVSGGWSIDPDAAEGSEEALTRVVADLAILELDRPVRLPQLPPIPAVAAPVGEGESLTVVSYARERSEAAALQDDCLFIGLRTDGALILDCVVDSGASGAPVIRMVSDEPRIIAVISARGEMSRRDFPNATVALAAPLNGPDGLRLLEATTPAQENRHRTPGEVRIRRPVTDGGGAGPGGARFVRPPSG